MALARFLAKNVKRTTALPAVLLFFTLLTVNFFIMPGALSRSFLVSFLNTNTAVICLTMGASVVIIAGGIDISLGPMVSVANVMLIKLLAAGTHYSAAIPLTVLATTAMGLLNGVLVAVLRGSSLLTTFAASTVYSGIALLVMPVPGGSVAREMTAFYNGSLLGIPATVFFILAPYVVWKAFKRTPHGIRLYAAGNNPAKAYSSAVNVPAEKLFAFGFAGFSAGIGTVALTSSIGSGDPLIGAQMSMMAISAAVIGGVSLSGGYGDITGGIFGSLFLGLITVIVLSSNISSFLQQFVSGVILLLGMIGAMLFTMRRGEKARRSADRGGGTAHGE
ncbi:MAG: ABC transporter permease [Planctomycetota bacterium]|jgi:ribose transport system permease protein|nr:ABC transporter permease [Planctomycetota bacterium]